MVPGTMIRTLRLDLIRVTAAIARADASDRAVLPALLGAHVPPEWPPPLLADHIEEFARKLEMDTDPPQHHTFYWLLDEARETRRAPMVSGAPTRVLMGSGGCYNLADNSWMIGYSVLDAYHGFGYATEAVAAIVSWAFQHPSSPRMIIATTFPELTPSIRVLEKNGFRFDGPGDEPRTIRYVRHREEWKGDGRMTANTPVGD